MFSFIFRIIYQIDQQFIFWHAYRAISKCVYAMGFRDNTPSVILAPEKWNPYAMNFFLRAECHHLRTNKDIAGCVLIEVAAFWRRQAEQIGLSDSDKCRTFFLYGSVCQEGANEILRKEWYAVENLEKNVEEAIQRRLIELREDPYEGGVV